MAAPLRLRPLEVAAVRALAAPAPLSAARACWRALPKARGFDLFDDEMAAAQPQPAGHAPGRASHSLIELGALVRQDLPEHP